MHRPTLTAFHDQQAGQATQSAGELYAEENSQAHIYKLPQCPVWSSGSTVDTRPPQFNEKDDEVLRSAVASNAPFAHIKAFMFTYRTDIDKEALESRARDINALWGREEDEVVRGFLATGKEPNHEFMTNLQKEWLPWRDLDTIRVRISYLKKNNPDGEAPQSEQRHGWNTRGDHLEPLGNTVAAPNHSNTDPYALLTGSVNQNFEQTSAGSAQTYPKDHPMNLHGFGTEALSTGGPARFQRHYTHNVQNKASGHLVDGLDYPDVNPLVFATKGPERGFDPNTTSAANDYYNNAPIDPGEYQHMGMLTEVFPQGQQYSDHNMPPYIARSPTAARNYPNAGLPPFQPAAATQSLAGLNTSSAPSYDSTQWAHQPTTPTVPGYPEQGSSNVSHEAGVVEDVRTASQLEKYVPEIKKQLAKNWSWQEVNAVYCPHYKYASMRDWLSRQGCKPWKRDQDRHLKIMRRNGYDWAQICWQLTGPPRTQEEVEARFRWLTGEASGE